MIPPENLFHARTAPASPDQPADFLYACHRRIEQRIDAIERAAAAPADRPEEALAALASAMAFLDTSGALHTEDEEESVFPRLRQSLERGEWTFLAGLEHDHVEADRLAARLREGVERARRGEPAWPELRALAEQFVALYRRHIAREDETLIPMVRRQLSADEQRQVAAEMRARRSPAAHRSTSGPAQENLR
ncbi:MAG: hypothetical protein KatS3mg004_2749 [Bryobacteraceae bacterium]|nr:MAG: hypothetical protein KatS3mg004_2749 [Bryobacteraceae bacterium]